MSKEVNAPFSSGLFFSFRSIQRQRQTKTKTKTYRQTNTTQRQTHRKRPAQTLSQNTTRKDNSASKGTAEQLQ